MAVIPISILVKREDDDEAPQHLKWLKFVLAVVFAAIVVTIVLRIHTRRIRELNKIKHKQPTRNRPLRRIPSRFAITSSQQAQQSQTHQLHLAEITDPSTLEPTHDRSESISSDHIAISALPPIYYDDRPPPYPSTHMEQPERRFFPQRPSEDS
ncbi:predicted protein [Scheffersomyces stipitis CBS 6054]|uniref:Uncharacterized protein n=1 Tax=Scheffersomyces stipitis (strain ATCC 58785 / CBS 6054 / NBRC 10063 / NRRL Y-11545) TaxID=322104 RepID=A3LP55_PICST|nr:predicted protein [Scheffersomyces stipitis CBS 6054]ABN64984.2 predicted protein [Scheffersomyces stipitis CBS 6054]